MIVDASAIVAIAVFEPGWESLAERLDQARKAYTHPISLYEAALAIGRIKGAEFEVGQQAVDEFVDRSALRVLKIGATEASTAVEAFARYGKGRHPAKLNMGDCFSYACAKLRGMPLLYSGDDFAKTDLA